MRYCHIHEGQYQNEFGWILYGFSVTAYSKNQKYYILENR